MAMFAAIPVTVVTFLIVHALPVFASDEAGDHASPPHVCIVGAGIAGATSAHFLSRLSNAPRVTVFERAGRVGGRIRTERFDGFAAVDVGATIIASSNRLMRHFATQLNLTTRSPRTSASMALWNGSHALFHTHPTYVPTRLAGMSIPLRAVARYGASLFRSRWFTRRLLRRYDMLYPNTEHPGATTWTGRQTVHELLERTGELYNLSQTPFEQVVDGMLSRRYVDEMVSAITRVNYGQEVGDMNGLAGSVALAGSGADLWSVEGGNEQVPVGLLRQSGATVRLNTAVQRVEKMASGRGKGYRLEVADGKGRDGEVECDAVVMGAPVETAGIELPKDMREKMEVGRAFQRTVATFVVGSLNRDTFGDAMADAVLTTARTECGFTSVGRAGTDRDGRVLWKVFSRQRLTEGVLGQVFEGGMQVVGTYDWQAYPQFRTVERFGGMDVGDERGRFVYTSPMESAGSAMEMSAVSGANAAALVGEALDLGADLRGPQRGEGLKTEL